MTLTLERLKELFHYDKETGIFTRIKTVAHNAKKGDIAGSYDKHGYLTIRIDGKSYKAHRLAWLFVTGSMPDEDIDHRNLRKDDNRFSNLRLASDAQNLWNTKVRPDCESGRKGVHIHKSNGSPTGLYRVRIRTEGVTRHVGYFRSPEDAARAYAQAAINDHGHFARAG